MVRIEDLESQELVFDDDAVAQAVQRFLHGARYAISQGLMTRNGIAATIGGLLFHYFNTYGVPSFVQRAVFEYVEDNFDAIYEEFSRQFKNRRIERPVYPELEPPHTAKPIETLAPTQKVTEIVPTSAASAIISINSSMLPNTYSCVKHTAMKPSMRKNDRVDYNDLNSFRTEMFTGSEIFTSAVGKWRYDIIGNHAMEAVIVADNPVAYTWNGKPLGFNTCYQRSRIFGAFGWIKPEYDASASYADTLVKGNDMFKLLYLKNQNIKLYFKNLTYNATDVATRPSESPIHVEVFLLQAKNNILHEDIAISNTLENKLAEGFEMAFTDDTGNRLANSRDQSDAVRYGHNYWLLDQFKIVEKKEFCMNPGQEVSFDTMLKPPQILSGKLFGEGIKVAATEAFLPVVAKGEQLYMVRFRGGLSPFDGSKVEFEAAKLGVYWTNTYDYGQITSSVIEHSAAQNLQTVITQNADVDMHNDDD